MPDNEEPPASSSSAGGPGEPDGERLTPEGSDVTAGLQELRDLTIGTLDTEADARRQELLEAALGYARRGLRVIPVQWLYPDGSCACPRGAECPSAAKHPVHDDWPEVATTDPELISRWWRPEASRGVIVREWFPFANIGIVTGRQSGIFVLDVDQYAGGMQSLAGYERRNGELPETRIHSTGRGGTHYFFAHPGFDVRNSAAKVLGKGLDIRGEHGFVVAPPSRSSHGAYELNPAHDIAPVPAPDWLLEILSSHDKGQNGSALSGQMVTEATGAARRYAEAAVKAEAEKMRNAPEGSRNDTLNECAFALGTLGGAGLLSEDAAWAALREAATAAGLTEGETRGTFLSGWKAGLKDPRSVQWQSMGTEWPTRAFTEFGMADRMADWYGDQLRWCPEIGTWMCYRNGVWHHDVKDAGEWYAQMMIRRLPDTEALSYDDSPEFEKDGTTELPSARDRFLAWVAKQETRKSVSSAARLATGVPLMRMAQGTLDGAPTLLNTTTCVVDLTTGEPRPHNPEDRMTLQAAAGYDRNATAPEWDRFLRRVQPDPEMRAYLQRVAGYCATGLTTEQVFFLWNGTGANGKSVAQNVLAHVLGSYAQTMPVDTLMASSVDGRIPNDVARMAGRRFLVASETRAGKPLDEQKIKQLTGGDTVSARYMRAEWFEFRPVGKIQLTTNHLPRMSDDSATWRRIHLINWPVVIPEEERDGFLQQRLIEEEAPGILNWIIEGALAWYRDGLNPPQAVYDAREAYKADEDDVAQFVLECLEEVDPVNGALGRDVRAIYAAYRTWCADNNQPAMGQKKLTSKLKLKAKYVRTNGWTGFPGLQVRQHFGPAGDDEGAIPGPSA
jgi:putative DNA primase/helicase